jgi:hypothetical protein
MNIFRAASALMLLFATTHATAAEALVATDQSVPLWIWIFVSVACSVFAVIVYSVIAFQPNDSSSEMKPPHDTARELAWTVVPIAIVIATAAPAMTNFASGSQALMTHNLQGCGERRSCREYSLSQLINLGADRCAAAMANASALTTSANSSQIATSCSTHR